MEHHWQITFLFLLTTSSYTHPRHQYHRSHHHRHRQEHRTQFHSVQLSALVLAMSLREEFKYWHQMLLKLKTGEISVEYPPIYKYHLHWKRFQHNLAAELSLLLAPTGKNWGFNIGLPTVAKKNSYSSKSINDQQAWLRGRSIVSQWARWCPHAWTAFTAAGSLCQKAL